jgi:outer membrane protein assembly factor BamB
MPLLLRNTVLIICLTSATAAAASNDAPIAVWPQFRGPGARGVAHNEALPDRWSASENVQWKTDVPGCGWSSPIVWDDRVFLTTVVNLGPGEEPKKGLYLGGNREKPPDSLHRWEVHCLDLTTGRVLWQQKAHEAIPQYAIHLKNSRASETPVTDGSHVYCYFGNVGVFCFDNDGRPLWSKPLQPHSTRFQWGTAASPVLHGDRLYLVNDNEEDSYLLALDCETGAEIWRVRRDEKSNWSTPLVWETGGRTEIVTPGTDQVRSYGLDGELLWSLQGMSSITIATPYSCGDLLYVSSGSVLDSVRPIYAIRPGGGGDISLAEDQTTNAWIAWCQRKAAPYNPSTLVYRDRLYVLYDWGFLACYDARTGAQIYDRQRIPKGTAFTASPWAYNGKVFCLNEDGVTFVFAAGDRYELLHSNPLAEDDMCLATPAIAGDRLLIRTARRVYCLGGR